MRGIAYQNHPAAAPFIGLIHSMAEHNLVVTLERVQRPSHPPTECRETVAQTLEAPLQRIVEARLEDIRKTRSAPGTHGHKPEYAAITQMQL